MATRPVAMKAQEQTKSYFSKGEWSLAGSGRSLLPASSPYEKIDKLDLIKIKIFCSTKDTIVFFFKLSLHFPQGLYFF